METVQKLFHGVGAETKQADEQHVIINYYYYY